jgi:putative two-component system response regulator
VRNTMKTEPGQFDHIVSQTPQGVFGQSLLIFFMTLLLQKYGIPGMTLYIWDVCAAALLLDRFLSCRRYCRNKGSNDSQQIRRSIQRYVTNVFLMGVLWAFLFAQIILFTPRELQFFALAIAYGIAGAAIATMGTIFRVYFAFIFPMLATSITVLYLQGSFTDIIFALILLLGMCFLLYTAYKYSRHFQLMHEKTERLRESEMEALICLGKACEYRDTDTGDHVFRVGYASYLLAKSAGFSEQDAGILMHAAPLHDLGKIGIPDKILLKPGKLTDEEQYVMKNHTRIGAEILKPSHSNVMKMARVVALSHHEKWNGSGFPDGLSGENIPIEGRIVAICDVFDALISSRHYKESWTDTEAIDFLRQSAGTHFDPDLVELFIQNIPQIKEFSCRQDTLGLSADLQPTALELITRSGKMRLAVATAE